MKNGARQRAHLCRDGLEARPRHGPCHRVRSTIARDVMDQAELYRWPDYRKHRLGEDARSATRPWDNPQRPTKHAAAGPLHEDPPWRDA